ncbi:hypothetical protein IWZ03DRAFT_431413 [Phyllosticta citriasiana]|uniref:Uncharacterized protein n=1 Tax=Phyllosticta citriasiana TaxID=595635 RepID=A0ABR1KBZ6_9PEZI
MKEGRRVWGMYPRPRPASWQRSRPAREKQELWEVGKQRRVKNRKEMYYAPSEMRVNVVRRKGGSAIRRRADKGRGEIPGDEREGRVRKRKRSGGSGSRPSGKTKEGPGIVGDGGETEDVVDLVDEQHVNENENRSRKGHRRSGQSPGSRRLWRNDVVVVAQIQAQGQPGPWADVDDDDDDDGLDAWLWREQARRRHTYDGGTIGAAGIALLRPSSLLQFRIIEAEFALGVRRGATRVARWALMEVALAGVGGSGRPRCG